MGLVVGCLACFESTLDHVAGSGYGQTGPKAREPGFASIGEAMAGLRYLNGEPGGRARVRADLSLVDTVAGLHGAMGVLLSLPA